MEKKGAPGCIQPEGFLKKLSKKWKKKRKERKFFLVGRRSSSCGLDCSAWLGSEIFTEILGIQGTVSFFANAIDACHIRHSLARFKPNEHLHKVQSLYLFRLEKAEHESIDPKLCTFFLISTYFPV
ncbi:hypothetical protein VNO77_18858 [Canavalia gladiata]|uniref:Uncharacterized protein n=1 Tax=Canavalia gladiata TaxID=3824 RepID=A0AAN9QK06_CANGL